MNQSHLEPQAITEFWKHDNEDMDLDADLLGLLQNNEGRDRKSKIKRHSRTKSHETGVQNKNISKEQFIDNQRTKPDIEEEADGHRNSIKPVKILSKIPLKSQHTLDEIGSPTQSPYSPSKFNPDYGQITERNITPVKYPAHQESHKKLLLIKKPSFNVGLSPVQNTVDLTSDRKNHLKVSALLDAKRNQTPQQTLLPAINSFHVRTHSHTPTLPPLQKLIDHSPLNLGEEISPNKSSFSPMRQNYRDSKTSLRNFEIIPQSIDEVVPIVAASVPNREAHRSPTIIRGVREVSREYLREKSSMMTPLFQQASNMWAPEGNEDGLKSLIKLPRLKKNISSENSPSLLISAQHENNSQNRIIKEGSPLNTLIDRKLTRVFTKATMNENIMFQKAASQQWRDMLGSTNE